MSGHLGDTSILATSLLLLLDLLIVQSLLLLFGHVATWTSHAGLWLWHRGCNVIRRSNIIGGFDTVLGTGWFRGVQAGLLER
jgi:hypothetical protein